MNSRIVFAVAVIAAFLLPLAVIGQEKKDAGTSVTGCFNKGADADHYVIKDEKSGKEVIVTGDAAMLSRHANNHKVTLTGTMAKEKEKDVLKATNLQMLAVCQ